MKESKNDFLRVRWHKAGLQVVLGIDRQMHIARCCSRAEGMLLPDEPLELSMNEAVD
jgi:hypothetical protein